jgi:hypothetical protein
MPTEDMEFLKGESDDQEKKWRIFEPYWEKASHNHRLSQWLASTL